MLLNDLLGDAESSSASSSSPSSSAVVQQKNQINSSFDIFSQYIKAGSNFQYMDPSEVDNSVAQLNIDEWSSMEEIKKEQQVSHDEINEKSESLFHGEQLDESLIAHASFTLTILEKLCTSISNYNRLKQQQYQQQQNNEEEKWSQLSDKKSLQAEKLLLSDRVIKLSHEIIELKTNLHILERQKMKIEKSLDRANEVTTELNEKVANLVNQSSMSDQNNEVTDGTGMDTNGTDTAAMSGNHAVKINSMNSHPGYKDELSSLHKQIALLETQLAESETAKAKVEMDLTERFARPMQQLQTDTQIADMRKAMEELRLQSKQRVGYLFLEVSTCSKDVHIIINVVYSLI